MAWLLEDLNIFHGNPIGVADIENTPSKLIIFYYSSLSSLNKLLLRLVFPVSPLGNSCTSPALLGLSLISKSLSLDLLRLHGVDSLKQDTLVLELVTLGVKVKGVVDVLVNLLGITHLVEETTEDTDATHPDDLEGETGVGSTTTLTDTCENSGNLETIHCELLVHYTILPILIPTLQYPPFSSSSSNVVK